MANINDNNRHNPAEWTPIEPSDGSPALIYVFWDEEAQDKVYFLWKHWEGRDKSHDAYFEAKTAKIMAQGEINQLNQLYKNS